MGDLTAAGKADALESGIGGWWISRHTAAPATGNQVGARLQVTSGEYDYATDGTDGTATLNSDQDFAAIAAGNVGDVVSHLGWWSASTGGTLYADDAVTDTTGAALAAAVLGEIQDVPDGEIVFTSA